MDLNPGLAIRRITVKIGLLCCQLREKTDILGNFLTALSTIILISVSAIITYISNKASVMQLVEHPHYIFYLFRLLMLVQFQHMFMIIIYYRKNHNLRKAVIDQISAFWKTWIVT